MKLLNKVMGDSELDVILDKVGPPEQDKYVPLGRLRLAVNLKVKEVHPYLFMAMGTFKLN